MPNSRESNAGAAADVGSPTTEAEADLDAELAQLEDRYKRALADLDNYRKRSARELERRVAEAKEAMLRDWLDVVDSVERAMRIESEGPCYDGLRAVLDQIDAVLAREGALRVGAPGDQFDPERHDAIAIQPSADVPDRTVLAVERSGYALGDRVVRPAQVVVARTPEHAY
jgi:molecular chaperone GrpE